MRNVVVHTESLRRRWIAPLCSLASLINFLLVCGAGILPLYIAWGSGPFWLRDAHRYEQPKVSFKSRMIVEISGMKAGTNGAPSAPFSYMWTSSPLANAMIGSESLKAMFAKTSSADNNLDGLNDEIFISATLPLQEGETVFAATLVGWFDASLQAQTRFQMDAALVHSATSGGLPANRLDVDGDLLFYQRDKLPAAPPGIYSPYLDAPLVLPENAQTVNDLTPRAVLDASRSRNFSLQVNAPTLLWTYENYVSGASESEAVSVAGTQKRDFTLSLRLRVPPSRIWLRPRISEELRWGYMQYVSFLVVTVIVSWFTRWVLFSLHIIDASLVVDAPRTATKLHLH